MLCFFASDLHGSASRYEKLFRAIERDRPAAVYLGGDLLPHHGLRGDFARDGLAAGFRALRRSAGADYPRVFLIPGNDDPRSCEGALVEGDGEGLWHYAHQRWFDLDGFAVAGYACVPPTPFRLKDWERYDVSRYVDPGCLSPEEGVRTVDVPAERIRHGTIAGDLAALVGERDLRGAVLLVHTPPHGTSLDRAALDDVRVDHAPVDVHVGSIALRRLIEEREPWLTLHGHVHESTRLTGVFKERLGRTLSLQAAHDGPELALVRFDLADPASAERSLI